jgi:hypothetical protein
LQECGKSFLPVGIRSGKKNGNDAELALRIDLLRDRGTHFDFAPGSLVVVSEKHDAGRTVLQCGFGHRLPWIASSEMPLVQPRLKTCVKQTAGDLFDDRLVCRAVRQKRMEFRFRGHDWISSIADTPVVLSSRP